jgi:hypothetical protein
MEDEHLMHKEQQLDNWLRNNPDIYRQLQLLLTTWNMPPLSEEEKQQSFEHLLQKMKSRGMPVVREEEEAKPPANKPGRF